MANSECKDDGCRLDIYGEYRKRIRHILCSNYEQLKPEGWQRPQVDRKTDEIMDVLKEAVMKRLCDYTGLKSVD